MAKVNLQPNEVILLQSEGASKAGGFFNQPGDLVLTNHDIIFVQKNMLGKSKGQERYPLNQLKCYNGQPQALLSKANGYPQLELIFQNEQVAFSFMSLSKREVVRWVDAITKVVNGETVDTTSNLSAAIPGAEFVAETVKDTLGKFSGALGISGIGAKIGLTPSNEQVTKRCISCRAPLSGTKGQPVKCQYCDTKQTL